MINIISNNFSGYKLMANLFKSVNSKQSVYSPAAKMVEVAPGYYCQNDPKIIANFKKGFDRDGDVINSQGVSGMDISRKNPSEWQQPIHISDEGKQKLFDMVKQEFIQNKGVLNGDTTRKSEVYADYQKSISKEDRLKATWTMGNLEQEYRNALISSVKQSNPNWKIGNSFDSSVLKDVTRSTVENQPSTGTKNSLSLRA